MSTRARLEQKVDLALSFLREVCLQVTGEPFALDREYLVSCGEGR